MQITHFDSVVRDLPALLTQAEVSGFLRMHAQTVRELVRAGELVAVQRRAKQGSPIKVTRDSVRDYLARNRRS